MTHELRIIIESLCDTLGSGEARHHQRSTILAPESITDLGLRYFEDRCLYWRIQNWPASSLSWLTQVLMFAQNWNWRSSDIESKISPVFGIIAPGTKSIFVMMWNANLAKLSKYQNNLARISSGICKTPRCGQGALYSYREAEQTSWMRPRRVVNNHTQVKTHH